MQMIATVRMPLLKKKQSKDGELKKGNGLGRMSIPVGAVNAVGLDAMYPGHPMFYS